MKCNEIKEMLSLYIDGELDDKEKLLFEEHILKCEDCRKELEDYKNLISMLQNLPEEEPPKGYCDRLHEKLKEVKLPKKVDNRFRWIKYGSIAAAFMLVFLIYAVNNSGLVRFNTEMGSTSRSKSENLAYDSPQSAEGAAPMEQPAAEAPAEYNYDSYDIAAEENEKAADNGEAETRGVTEVFPMSIQVQREMKIIKSGNIITQTENFDLFINDLISTVNSMGGFIEQNNTSVRSIYDNKQLKYGNLKIRVPQDKFYEFVSYLEETSEINQKNIAENDATKEYYEKDNKVKNLEIQEAHLRELFEKAQTVEEMLQIENELRRIRTEIDALNISLNDIDDRVSMSTISLEVEEVLKANLTVTTRENLWERSKEGFINTVNGIVDFAENIVIFIVSLSPVLLPVIILFIIVIIKVRKKRKL